MPTTGFLWGEVKEGGLIVGRLFYVLEEVEWLIAILDVLEDCTQSSLRTKIRVIDVTVAASHTIGTSCLALDGTLPDCERIRRLLDWPCDSVPVTLPPASYWRTVLNKGLVPFQCVTQEIAAHHTHLKSGYEYSPMSCPPLPNYEIAHKASITPGGLVYHFSMQSQGRETRMTSPTIPWKLIENAVEPYRHPVRTPKRQTIILRPNPGLKGG